MPIRTTDPFSDKIQHLLNHENPYVDRLANATDCGLPAIQGREIQTLKGGWRDRLNISPDAPLVVEIGCHKGRTLLEMARALPNYGFIGLDITFKRIVTTAERVKRQKLDNVLIAFVNGVAIDLVFAPKEIDGIILFYPDPWIKKKRQRKHRLVTDAFVRKVRQVLKDDGFFWMKSDQEPYIEESHLHMSKAGFRTSKTPFSTDFSSSFERRFHQQKLPTFAACWRKLE